MLEQIIRDRRALHMIPEVRFDLPETKAYIVNELNKLNCTLSFAAVSGVAAFFDAGKSETVAFRTDMDALEVTENTDADFASVHAGKMHACGHDGHMAMMLAFARWVNENIGRLPRNVLLIFQPSEESGAGGAQMSECDAFVNSNVKRVFAIHVEPALPLGEIATRKGPHMAQATEIYINIKGRAGHAAIPGAGIDALEAAAEIVHECYQMEREIAPEKLRRIKFCGLQAGNTINVIVGEAKLMGTMRTFDKDTFAYMKKRIQEICADIEKRTGAQVDLRLFEGYPAVINNAELIDMAKKVYPISDIPEPTYIGEDFSYYQLKTAGVMFRLGLGTGIPLHASNFCIDERALVKGVELYQALAEME